MARVTRPHNAATALALLILAWTPLAVRAQGEVPPPSIATPNIIVILADDMGIDAVSAFNPDTTLKTPAIDRLARQGMSFTDAHLDFGRLLPDTLRRPDRALQLALAAQARDRRKVGATTHRGRPTDTARDAARARLRHGLHRQVAPRLALAQEGRRNHIEACPRSTSPQPSAAARPRTVSTRTSAMTYPTGHRTRGVTATGCWALSRPP